MVSRCYKGSDKQSRFLSCTMVLPCQYEVLVDVSILSVFYFLLTKLGTKCSVIWFRS